MSILKRTGTGINDVAYQDGIAAGQKVFTKDQKWSTTAAGGTYNCLHRTGSGIADVAYQNEAIGKALSTYGVGSIVKIKENGANQNFIVLSHGYPASNRTLLMRQSLIKKDSFTDSNESYYDGSKYDNYLNSTYLNTIDSKVRSSIIPVNIESTITNSQYQGEIINISKKVFALSLRELGLGNTNQYDKEGKPIQYFDSNGKRIMKLGGSAEFYWTRTVWARQDGAYNINKSGGSGSGVQFSGGTSAYMAAFTLPFTVLVNSSTNEVIG